MRENIVGTSWLCVDPVFFDQRQVLLGIEALHDDRGAAVADRQPDRGLRRRVVERRGRQVHHAFAVAPQLVNEIEQRQLLRTAAAPAAAAGCLWVGRWSPTNRASTCRARSSAIGVAGKPAVASSRLTMRRRRRGRPRPGTTLDLRTLLERLQRDRALRLRGDQHLRFAVVDDVGHFFGRQIRIDASVVEAGAFARAQHST